MIRTDFVCLTLVDPRGRVLMQELDEHAPRWPGMWCFPGGGLDPGEAPVDGAVRELEEETAIRVSAGALADLGPFEVKASRGQSRFHFFAARTTLRDAQVRSREGRQVGFVDPGRWEELDLVPPSRAVLPALTAWIEQHPPAPSPDAERFVGVLLVDPDGRVLLQERDEHPRIDPGKWGLCGGHVEPGEEFEAGAHRELEEETGVRAAPGELQLWREVVVDHREAYGRLDRMQVFVAGADLTDADIDCREGRRIVFVDPDTVRRLDLGAAAAVALPAFLESDTYRRLRRRTNEAP